MSEAPAENDCTREGFAKFLRRLAADKVSTIEWNRFICQHYGDELMEAARRAIARRSIDKGIAGQWSDSDLAAMQSWSRRLRGADC